MLDLFKKDEWCDTLEMAVAKVDASDNEKKTTFEMESLTECPRRLTYKISGYDYDNSGAWIKKKHQEAIRDKWIAILSKSKEVRVIKKRSLIGDVSSNIAGILDAFIEIDNIHFCVKIKAIDSNDFDLIKEKGPFRTHVIELMVCMWLAEVEDGILVYEDNSSQLFQVFHSKLYEPFIKSITAKCKKLMEYQVRSKLPPIPADYKKRDARECLKCEFINTCKKITNG